MITIVAVVAHSPAVGVKVKVAVPVAAVLTVAGFHVPVIPFVEIAGSTGAVLLWHSGPTRAKIGVTGAVIVIFKVAVVAH